MMILTLSLRASILYITITTAGLMFFSTGERSGGVGVGGKLERALMDGRERTTIVSSNIVFPHGVAVDAPNR